MSPEISREKVIDVESRLLASVYHKRDVVAVRGRGALLWDEDGREFIDCMIGYGSSIVGHCHPRVVRAVQEQAEKLLACHGSLYSEGRARLLNRLVKVLPTQLCKIFLSNSGAESVETAIKLARKFTGKRKLVAMMRSFHGKTLGALSLTWNQKYRAPFGPLIPQVSFVPFGKAEKVKEAVDKDTAAIILEPIQGESGVYVAPEGFLAEVREIADTAGALLIFDEVQTGFGRTGRFFAFEHWKVIPDILCLSKAAGSGVPIGITAADEAIMGSLKTGEHSSTFGGNPLACAAAAATIDVIVEENLCERAATLGSKLRESLNGLKEKYSLVREVRGLGLMVGVEMRFDILDLMRLMLAKGVITINSGVNVLRFLPPATITTSQLQSVISRLDNSLAEVESKLKRQP